MIISRTIGASASDGRLEVPRDGQTLPGTAARKRSSSWPAQGDRDPAHREGRTCRDRAAVPNGRGSVDRHPGRRQCSRPRASGGRSRGAGRLLHTSGSPLRAGSGERGRLRRAPSPAVHGPDPSHRPFTGSRAGWRRRGRRPGRHRGTGPGAGDRLRHVAPVDLAVQLISCTERGGQLFVEKRAPAPLGTAAAVTRRSVASASASATARRAGRAPPAGRCCVAGHRSVSPSESQSAQ
ncbi:hypothetical protein C8J29_104494 [Cereibacter johrii]|uniref:Uncharacterized protein n=1 Tax=Cereibacter johrii TaxID=445629 RepID=A0ABX5JBR1_9RHOB|nr:hypothetical protein C8J29_104494 [Cereibacter johrii]